MSATTNQVAPGLLDRTISDVSALIEKGDVSPVELVEACLRRIEAVDERLHDWPDLASGN